MKIYKASKNPHSITKQFIKWYSIILLFVVFILSTAVITTVSVYLFQNEQKELYRILEKVEQVAKNQDVNWSLFIEEISDAQNFDFELKIDNTHSGETFYSDDWEDFFDTDEPDRIFRLPWLSSVYWHEDEGFYYQENITLENGTTITIIASLENITEFIQLLGIVLLIFVSLSTIIGFILIVLITQKNVRPITKLTESVNLIDYKEGLAKGIVVPTEPKEIANLGHAFNSLLSELASYIENEKNFVASASHELRTPIAAIHGNVNLIRRRGEQHPEIIAPTLEAVYQETVRMEKLISQLLTMTRMEHNQLEKNKMNISETVEEVIKTYWKSEQIVLVSNIEKNLFINGNQDQIRQILIILLDNARKYTEANGQVQVSLRQEKDSIYLQVVDTGIGIAKEDLDKIFKRFYRVDKARSRVTGGTGLGLSIAKQIVKQHGGSIHVKSEINQGTEFTIVFQKRS